MKSQSHQRRRLLVAEEEKLSIDNQETEIPMGEC